MRNIKYLIIGGGIAGTSAAETIRQNDQAGSIAIISDEPHRLYSRISLMNYLKGSAAKENLFLRKPEFYKEKQIEFLSGIIAKNILPDKKTITLSDGSEIQYDKLLIASGAKARAHPLSAKCPDGIYNFWTLEDTDKLVQKIGNAKSAVVVGGGFVGLELVVSFAERKLETTYLIREPYFWPAALDQAGGEMIQKVLADNGVNICVNEEVADIEGNGKLEAVLTKSGKKILADILGVGIGTIPNVELAKDAGIKTNRGIIANEYMETSVPGICAAGDVAEFYDVIAKKSSLLGNWAFSREQGKIAGLGMVGKKTIFKQVPCNSLSFFKCYIGFIGNTVPLPDTQVIVRDLRDRQGGLASPTGGYTRIFINDGRISGASILNCLPACMPLTKLVQSEISIDDNIKGRLSDPATDLAKLSAEILQT